MVFSGVRTIDSHARLVGTLAITADFLEGPVIAAFRRSLVSSPSESP